MTSNPTHRRKELTPTAVNEIIDETLDSHVREVCRRVSGLSVVCERFGFELLAVMNRANGS